MVTMLANAAAACAHCRTIIKWPERDKEFAERWNDAVEQGIDRLEEEAIRRAVAGVDGPAFFQGRIVGYTKE